MATLFELLLHPLIPRLYLRNLPIPVDLRLAPLLGLAPLAARPRRTPRQRLVELIAMNVLYLLDLRELGIVDERAGTLRLCAVEIELRSEPKGGECRGRQEPHRLGHLSRGAVNPCQSGLIL